MKIDKLFTQLVELLLHAGYAEKAQKTQIVAKASTVLDALKFFLHIAWETKTLDTKKYIALSANLVEVGKMLGGWRKQLEQQTHPTEAR